MGTIEPAPKAVLMKITPKNRQQKNLPRGGVSVVKKLVGFVL
jgi:hypothetical protein